jgi:hypothetical protein
MHRRVSTVLCAYAAGCRGCSCLPPLASAVLALRRIDLLQPEAPQSSAGTQAVLRPEMPVRRPAISPTASQPEDVKFDIRGDIAVDYPTILQHFRCRDVLCLLIK